MRSLGCAFGGGGSGANRCRNGRSAGIASVRRSGIPRTGRAANPLISGLCQDRAKSALLTSVCITVDYSPLVEDGPQVKGPSDISAGRQGLAIRQFRADSIDGSPFQEAEVIDSIVSIQTCFITSTASRILELPQKILTASDGHNAYHTCL
jgi:hypothetical protein